MRANTATIFGWLIIALMLFAGPELSVIVPPARAVLLSGDTPLRPYGPYAQQVKVSVYTNDASELTDFRGGKLDYFDWTLKHADFNALQSNGDAFIAASADAGMFQTDINHHAGIFGIATQQARTDFTTFPDGGIGGLPASTKEPTANGILAIKAIEHLIDKSSFINAGDCASGFCSAVDDPIPYAVCGYPAGAGGPGSAPFTGPLAPCTTYAQRAAWDNLFSTTTLCATGTLDPCAFRLAPGANGNPSVADLAAAKTYLQAAGLILDTGTGKLCFPASGQTGNCSAASGSGQIIYAIRSDDPKRRLMGTIIANAIDSIFDAGPGGIPVTHRILGNISQLGKRVFLSVPADDWNLYTGGWGLALDATHFNGLYDADFASNFCGGDPSLFNLNYGFYCNPQFNFLQRKATFTDIGLVAFNADMQAAANAAGNTGMILTIYSRNSQTLAHNGWAGLVNVNGAGFESDFNWSNAYQKAGYVSTGGLGLPGGGNPNLLRAGFRQGTDSLNEFQAGTVWEAHILGQIYDSPGHFNPRGSTATPDPAFSPYEALLPVIGTPGVTETFCHAGADCVTALNQVGFHVPGVPDTEPVTVVQLIFRNDILFHDGVQLTANDYVKSILAYRDVPQGGFGQAAAFANLLDVKVPIPLSSFGSFSVQLTFDGQSFLNKLNALGAPILPLHVWDTNGDGFICSDLGLGSCAGRAADFSTAACNTLAQSMPQPAGNNAALAAGCIEVTGTDFDPMASGFLIGSGPFQCLDLDTGKPGGSCSQTAAGAKTGQAVGPNGRFLLTRNDKNAYCCPTDPNGATLIADASSGALTNAEINAATPLARFAMTDQSHFIDASHFGWIIDVLDLSIGSSNFGSTGNSRLALAIATSADNNIGGTFGASTLFDSDRTNVGNTYTIGY